MPYIDVTDVLLDSEIAGQPFTVIRRQQVMGSNGVLSMTPTTIPNVVGSIVPTGDESLVREEAYQVQAKTIQVITNFRLRGEARDANAQDWQPDLILFNGDYFIVKTVDDFTPFGAGMVSAECTSTDYVDQPPPEDSPNA